MEVIQNPAFLNKTTENLPGNDSQQLTPESTIQRIDSPIIPPVNESIESENSLMLVQRLLTTVAGFSTIALFLGAIVLHTHLGQYVNFPIPNIPPQYYITAGIIYVINLGFLIASVALGLFVGSLLEKPLFLVDKIKSPIRRLLVSLIIATIYLGVVAYLLTSYPIIWDTIKALHVPYGLLVLWYVMFSDVKDKNLQYVGNLIKKPVLFVHHAKKKMINLVALIIYIFYMAFLIGSVYSSNGYAAFSSIFWGGKPASVQLIFDIEFDATSTYVVLSKPHQSEPVCLLLQTPDQFLLYEPLSKQSFTLPASRVVSVMATDVVIDCSPKK